MSCVLRRIAAHGSRVIEPVPYAAESLSEAAQYERPGGVYAAFGTWHNRSVVRLTDHLDRFEDSARRVGFELRIDRDLLRAELCDIMRDHGLAGARIRISSHPLEPFLTAAFEPYSGPPPELRINGVSCRTARHAARSNPHAKQTDWLTGRSRLGDLSATSARAAEPYEWLLLDDDDRILEGAGSNFYAIIPDRQTGPDRDLRLRTARKGILAGIARSIVLEIAPEVIPVTLEPASVEELSAIREAFITSASRGIIPVVEIDDETLGDGRPGPVTSELIEQYDRRAIELEEPLCDT